MFVYLNVNYYFNVKDSFTLLLDAKYKICMYFETYWFVFLQAVYSAAFRKFIAFKLCLAYIPYIHHST